MISITRLPEPQILREKREQWLAVYFEHRADNSSTRPDSRQYAHREIKNTLEAMSFHKCFYCETKLRDSDGEVEHYIEVAEAPARAFDWDNLYLSCHSCNRRKLANSTIPVSECIDPCDLTEDPTAHLTFDDEYIRPKANSTKGAQTIHKYQLDRAELDYLRLKQLQLFERTLRELRERQVRDGSKQLNAAEKELLSSFKEPHHAFSAMFQAYLSRLGL